MRKQEQCNQEAWLEAEDIEFERRMYKDRRERHIADFFAGADKEEAEYNAEFGRM